MSLAEQQQLEETYVMHTFGRKPVELVEGEGMVVRDDAGKEYLDFIAGIGAVSLGHCHPAVVRAITEQASTLIHVSNYYYIEHRGGQAALRRSERGRARRRPGALADVLRELGRRGERVRHQARPRLRAPSR